MPGPGIPYLTVYAFSTENWKRPVEEVSAIMDLLRKYLLEALEKMEKDGFRIRFFGDLEALPPELRTLCLETEETGAAVAGAKYQINVCLNYGGRDEILRAARAWGRDVLAGRQGVEDLTDEVFSRYLDSRAVPDPDLIIRPSGELGCQFLLWQWLRRVLFYRCARLDFSPRSWTRPGGLPAASAQILEAYNVRNRILVACVGVPVILVVLYVLPAPFTPALIAGSRGGHL
ncbi:MAG: polyprenyl diphosphate synthase [Evtepia gabavorous]